MNIYNNDDYFTIRNMINIFKKLQSIQIQSTDLITYQFIYSKIDLNHNYYTTSPTLYHLENISQSIVPFTNKVIPNNCYTQM